MTTEEKLDSILATLALIQAKVNNAPQSNAKPITTHIIDLVANDTGVSAKLITGRRRHGNVAWARQLTSWLFKQYLGWSNKQIADLFNCDISSPANSMYRVREAIENKDKQRVQQINRLSEKVQQLLNETR